MKKTLTILVIMVFSVSLVWAAEDVLPKLDKGKDGKVSRKEYIDGMARTFDQYDRNGDGILTREEIRLIDKIDAEKFIQEADADRDGKILKREFEQAAKKRFTSMDKNRSGYIENKEWQPGRSEPYSPFTLFTF